MGNRGHLVEPYGYARPLSPWLLWIELDAVVQRAPPLIDLSRTAVVNIQGIL